MLNNRIGNVTMVGAMMAAVLLAAMPAKAIDWLSGNTFGFVDVGGEWVGGTAPGPTDSMNFPSIGVSANVRWDASSGDTTVASVLVDNSDILFDSDNTNLLTVTGNVLIDNNGTLTLGRVVGTPMDLDVGGQLRLESGSTLNVRFDSDVTAGSLFFPGAGGAPSVVNVDGVGSTLNVSGLTDIGLFGSIGTLNLINGSTGNSLAGTVLLVNSSFDNSVGNLNVTGGSQLSAGNIDATTLGNPGQAANILVDGASSRITQTGASTFDLGTTSTGTGTLTVSNNGRFETGTGVTNINATGTVNILSNGTFDGNGTVNLNSGSNFNYDSPAGFSNIATLNVNSSSTYTQDNGIMSIDVLNLNGGAFNVNNGVLGVNDLNGLTTLDINGFFSLGSSNIGPSASALTVGSGQSLDVTNTFSVGEVGKAATLVIENGGSVTADNNARIGGFSGTAGSSITLRGASTFSVGGTMRVGGSFAGPGGASTLTVDGDGIVSIASVGGPLIVFPGSTVAVIDSGRLTSNGATIDGAVNVNTDGRFTGGAVDVNAGGLVNLESGGLFFADTLAINGGTFNNPDTNTRLIVNVMDQIGVLNLAGGLEVGSADAGGTTSNVTIDSGERINMTAGANAVIGGFASTGHMTINNGGQFNSAGSVRLGSLIVPGSTLDVNAGGVMNLQGDLQVTGSTVDVPTTPASTLTIDGAGARVNVGGNTEIDEGAIVNVANGGELRIDGDIDIDGGVLEVIPSAGGAGNDHFFWNGQTMTVANGGRFRMAGNYFAPNNATINVIGSGSLIEGGVPAAGIQAFEVFGPTTASAGGTIRVDSLAIGDSSTTTITGSGSRLEVGVGAIVGYLGDGTLRLADAATGSLATGGASTTTIGDEFQSQGLLEVLSDADLVVGSIALNPSGDGVSGIVNVSGPGSTLSQNDGSTLVIGASASFDGFGRVNVTDGGVVNTGDGTTTLNTTGTINANTDGLMIIGSGAGFPFAPFLSSVQVTAGGRLEGNGTINATTALIGANGGVIAPGLSTGILTVNGQYTNVEGATLEIEINGATTPGTDYDQLVVSSAVFAFGNLDLLIGGGYVPTLGDEVDFILAGGAIGPQRYSSITNVVQAGNLGLAVRHDFDAGQVDMRVSIRGDTDFDDDVDTGDLTTAIIGFTGAGGSGSSWVTGDFDGDADTDTGDLTTGIINFTGASAANPNVPDLIYDPATGNVTIDADGADVISFSLQAGPFSPADFSGLPAGLTDNIASQIGWTSFNLFTGLTGSADLGAILPAGLNQAGLEAALTTASYGLALAGGGGGGRLDIIIPEPASLALLGLGAVVLVRRRRAA